MQTAPSTPLPWPDDSTHLACPSNFFPSSLGLKKPTLGLELGLIINRIIRISINRYLLSIVYNSVALSIKFCIF